MHRKDGDSMISGIYKITNKINNNSYIGSSNDIYGRWKRHLINSKNPNLKYYDYPIYKAIRKYKKENFILEILEEVKPNIGILIEKEKYYYNLLQPEYNQMEPNFVPRYDPSEEEKIKISIKYSGEGNPFYGKKHSEEVKKFLSEEAKKRIGNKNPFYGHAHSNETKEKISLSNGKEVMAISFTGEEICFRNAIVAGE